MMSDSFQPSLQLKGEIMDLEFTLDTDHRKRRRNRTTQSCLNCHTSKRKCDRKRPCQRCIQLGLTGLCVYEIDDPALRDDPTLDETTRLRNRIAELESLVRELRGKPHPRWADSNFRDGDPNEKWHSRASKTNTMAKRRSPDETPQHSRGGVLTSLLAPIKTEAPSDNSQQALYRFSPSPGPSMRYHTFQTDLRNDSPASPFEHDHRHPMNSPPSGESPQMPFPSSAPSMSYIPHHGASGYVDGNRAHHGASHGYPLAGHDDYAHTGPHCPCRTSPATGHAYISLSHQLQSTLNAVRQYSPHPSSTQCLLYRRIVELHNQLHGNDPTDVAGPSYDSLSNTPTDSEILTPLSASSGHTSFHATSSSGSGGVSPQEWNTLSAAAGYNPYFPMPPGDHSVYNHVIS
ncbi:hypothetical protein HGRIS_006456 [Hohenbuehelia grisea]|uniref:Zn(2)-C6 fungal-type domain-containing protein n=1 Tax=Hohenbuehelia grisea TaxID=104357 RepID=A0ABR3K1S6_9AGAR